MFPGKWGFPGGSDGKESACNAGDLRLTMGQEDPLEKELATHSQDSCLENPMDGGAWRAIVTELKRVRND